MIHVIAAVAVVTLGVIVYKKYFAKAKAIVDTDIRAVQADATAVKTDVAADVKAVETKI